MRLLTLLLLIGVTGCYQKMAVQPAYRPQQPSDFFPDGRSERPPVPGTVARGQLAQRTDTALYQGKDAKGALVSEFPFAMTKDVLERGRERYDIFCVVCHGPRGDGDGRIVQRGFTKPPNYHSDLSRGYKLSGKDVKLTEVPAGYIFDVITRGYGAMPDLYEQIPVSDRWAITGYVRALQASRAPEKEKGK